MNNRKNIKITLPTLNRGNNKINLPIFPKINDNNSIAINTKFVNAIRVNGHIKKVDTNYSGRKKVIKMDEREFERIKRAEILKKVYRDKKRLENALYKKTINPRQILNPLVKNIKPNNIKTNRRTIIKANNIVLKKELNFNNNEQVQEGETSIVINDKTNFLTDISNLKLDVLNLKKK